MGHRAAVVGAGHTRFGVLPEGPRELLRQAIDGALATVDRGVDPKRIGRAYLATLGFGGWQIGNASALVAEELGVPGLATVRVENACASGGFAVQEAAREVASGGADLVLVAGLEKMTDVSSARRRYWLGVSGDTEWERQAGLTFAGVYGLIASQYVARYPRAREALAEVAVKNHANGALNPNAHFRKPVSREQAMASPKVADPLGLFDCCPVSDGAAAVLLASAELAPSLSNAPVYLDGWGAASDDLAVQQRPELTSFAATRAAARQAYRAAGCGPDDLRLVEAHDCFTIAELLALEDLGFASPGGAVELTLSGATRRDGRLPVNPDGGLKSKGHPIGATGVSQVYEVFRQLRREAGERQVAGATRALTHNVGGAGATAAVAVFSTE